MSTRLILTIDLIDLKPYFHRTANRGGAPFWGSKRVPYRPVESSVRSFTASSRRGPSTYGQENPELGA